MMNTRNMDCNIEKRCITQLLFVLNGLHFFDLYFQMHVMSKRRPRTFLIFVYEMLCHWSTSDTNLVGNDLKATGDMGTFT